MQIICNEVVCPYCNTINKVTAEIKEGLKRVSVIEYCNTDIGGCDKRFIADLRINITAETKKVYGEESSSEKK